MKQHLLWLGILCNGLVIANEAHTLHTYMMANFDDIGNNPLRAERRYRELLKSNCPMYAYKGYIHFLNRTGQFQKITELAPQIEKRFQNDPDLGLIFAQAFKKIGNVAEADKRMITLSQTFRQHPEIVLNAVETLVQRKELTNALNLINTFLDGSSQKPSFFVFYFLKAQIFAQMQQFDNALVQAKKSLKMQPNFPQAWLFVAMLEEQAGHYEQAIKGLTTYLEKSGAINPQIQQHILALTLKQATSRQNSPFIVINLSCFQKAMHHFKQKNYPLALSHINRCLEEKPKDEEARLLKIQILVAMSEVEQAITHLVTWAREPHGDLWAKTLHLLVRANAPIEKVVTAFESITAKKPNDVTPLLYLADLYSRAHKYEPAVTYLNQALEKTSDTALKTKIYFHLGLLHYHANNFEKAQEVLEKGEQLHSEFPPLLNLLSYLYATKGKEVAKADELINRALKKDKTNPHYLDTKALVLYKQKQYPKAVAVLEKIAQKNPHDSTVLIHLAKAQHKQGMNDRALQTITAAKNNAKQTHDQLRIQKLTERWQKETT